MVISITAGYIFVFGALLYQEAVETGIHLDPSLKEVTYNPTFETMFAPEVSLWIVLYFFKQLIQIHNRDIPKNNQTYTKLSNKCSYMNANNNNKNIMNTLYEKIA